MQFDPRNWMAAYQLGQLKFHKQRFREAQNAFAYGLLFAPDNPEMLQALAVSSYYAQDMETALGAINKVQEIRHNHPDDLGTAAMVYSALGEFEDAKVYADQLGKIQNESPIQIKRLSRRMDDWRRFHKRTPGMMLAQRDGRGMIEAGEELFGQEDTERGLKPKSDSRRSSSRSRHEAKKEAPQIPKMVLVDVVIIRSEELRTTDKGVNLLNGLSLTLAGDLFDFQRAHTVVKGGDTSTPNDEEKTNVNFKVSLPSGGITYNLNIFNDKDNRNEVLARPTLVALDGEKSEFFSGSVFHVQLDGVSGSRGTVADVPVGIKLSITPKFLNEDTIQIKVEAARAFLESRSSSVGFSNFSQVSKTRISANVVMKFEETLVLSGLSEKEDEFIKDGVPFLQDIPGLQYLFSHEDTLEFTKSVLILITPHKPRYTYRDGTEKVSRENPPDKEEELVNLAELKSRPDWFKPASNLDAVFAHLKDRRMYREFQSGDIRMERWDDSRKLETKIKRTLEFLYY